MDETTRTCSLASRGGSVGPVWLLSSLWRSWGQVWVRVCGSKRRYAHRTPPREVCKCVAAERASRRVPLLDGAVPDRTPRASDARDALKTWRRACCSRTARTSKCCSRTEHPTAGDSEEHRGVHGADGRADPVQRARRAPRAAEAKERRTPASSSSSGCMRKPAARLCRREPHRRLTGPRVAPRRGVTPRDNARSDRLGIRRVLARGAVLAGAAAQFETLHRAGSVASALPMSSGQAASSCRKAGVHTGARSAPGPEVSGAI